ncbi:proteasome non-atpase regulatory subunit 6 [Suillus placidus]|uniref:Proteasome non-atpase regulatory subunit 6 n=1 Tax=Suillus placidus TaxID=48579 RepID=A0A9P6ZGT0_9AGAM|nr:proteasome non-atpase regulatory subunit 6 [Suillus placidus]KAG1764481.1 proteasome non-atpase regulatory subunit 6 [Suillus placidus]
MIKQWLITVPEVISVLPKVPILGDLLNNLYDFATLEQMYLLPSRFLSPHTRYYVREMRILAYSQLLESYRSLTLETLTVTFV